MKYSIFLILLILLTGNAIAGDCNNVTIIIKNQSSKIIKVYGINHWTVDNPTTFDDYNYLNLSDTVIENGAQKIFRSNTLEDSFARRFTGMSLNYKAKSALSHSAPWSTKKYSANLLKVLKNCSHGERYTLVFK